MEVTNGLQGVCVIILNWNSRADTISCVRRLDWRGGHVVVVDNGSCIPEELAILRRGLPYVHVIPAAVNAGYAAGMNIGMRWALAEGFRVALLLNPDTDPDLDVVRAMSRVSDGAGLVGIAQTKDMTSTHECPGVRYVTAALLEGMRPRAFTCPGCSRPYHEVDVVTGAGLLVNLSAASSVGFMDESYFHYKEEFDFCYRLKKAGYSVRFCCSPVLKHRGGGSLGHSSQLATYYHYRNELLFLRRHASRWQAVSMVGLWWQLANLMLAARGFERAVATVMGVWDAVAGSDGRCPYSRLKA